MRTLILAALVAAACLGSASVAEAGCRHPIRDAVTRAQDNRAGRAARAVGIRHASPVVAVRQLVGGVAGCAGGKCPK